MDKLKTLAHLDMETKMVKYKNVPAYAIPRTKYSDNTANALTQSILRFLELKGHYCSRIQSQGQYNPTLGKWTKSNVKRGIGDVMAVINGRSVMIEIKVGNDKQSGYQKQTEREVINSGGLYMIAKTFDDFEDFYNKIINN